MFRVSSFSADRESECCRGAGRLAAKFSPSPTHAVYDSGIKVTGLGFRVQGLASRVTGLWCMV